MGDVFTLEIKEFLIANQNLAAILISLGLIPHSLLRDCLLSTYFTFCYQVVIKLWSFIPSGPY